MSKHIRRGQTILGVIWGGIINLYLVLHLISPYEMAPVIVLTHLAHWVLLFSVVVFLLAMVLRARPLFLLWLLPGVIGFLWWYSAAWLPKPDPHVAGAEFTAATYNVLGFMADPDQTFAVIETMDADIVGLQELRPTLEARLKTDLSDKYPYQITKVVQGFDGYGLLSRYPILDYEIELTVDLDNVDFDNARYLRAILDIEGQPIVVYVFHPPIPMPSPQAAPLKYLFQYDDTNLHTATRILAEKIADESLPVLLICDCNTTPRSRQYELLDKVLYKEAFGAQGRGLGLTLPADSLSPLVRIDYLWYTDEFAALDAKVWSESGTSDHYPVWGNLVLKK